MSKLNLISRTIFTGDNLPILRGINSEAVDLIYLDPPFNKKRQFAAPIGSRAAGAAFKDTWTFADTDAEWLGEISDAHPALNSVIHAAGETGGKANKAYLIYLAIRLLEMRRVLNPRGSIYLHCDPTMSHSLKLTMDAVFGAKNFRNEIVWCYARGGRGAKQWAKKHDIILFYTKSGDYHFDASETRLPRKKTHMKIVAAEGEDYQVKRDKHSGKEYRYPLSAGVAPSDWWDGIQQLNYSEKERVGYPTQKPLALLSRIILASSNPGDAVLDPFCGYATTCEAAEALKRKWVGIDISPKAAELIRHRLSRRAQMETGAAAQKTFAAVIPKLITRTDIPARTDIQAVRKTRNFKRFRYGMQEGFCAGCREHFQIRQMEIDHIVPVKDGGGDNPENLQLLCAHCNRLKSSGTMAQLRARLKEYLA